MTLKKGGILNGQKESREKKEVYQEEKVVLINDVPGWVLR
jgi:hypothetical protein